MATAVANATIPAGSTDRSTTTSFRGVAGGSAPSVTDPAGQAGDEATTATDEAPDPEAVADATLGTTPVTATDATRRAKPTALARTDASQDNADPKRSRPYGTNVTATGPLTEGVNINQPEDSHVRSPVPISDLRPVTAHVELVTHTSGFEDTPISPGQRVGRLGIEPRTRGLKVRCSAG